MSVPVIAFFNNKGGVGTTSLVYHLAWMFSDLGVKVLAADLDPQADLTAAFLPEDLLKDVWAEETRLISTRIADDSTHPILLPFDDNLVLLPGNVMLSGCEDELSAEWSRALSGSEQAISVLSAFWRAMQNAAAVTESQIILMDLGPNLGSITRAAMIAADYVVFPLAPDLFSVLGLEILGSTLRKWRGDWQERVSCGSSKYAKLPAGKMTPLGYVVQQPSVVMKTAENWINWIPDKYRKFVLDAPPTGGVSIFDDPQNLSVLRPYRTLLSMAQEARKPMFHLKPADGATGAHLQSAEEARKDFDALARAIITRAKLPITLAI